MTDEMTPEIEEVFAKAYAYLMRRRHIRLARATQQTEQISPATPQDVTDQNPPANDRGINETA